MKKGFTFLFLLLLLTGCGGAKNQTTLTKEEKEEQEFQEDLKEAGITERTIYVNSETKPYDCDALKEDILYYNGNYILTKNQELYAISSSLYSNNKNCKKVSDIKIKRIVGGSSAFDTNNQLYSISYDSATITKKTDDFLSFLNSYYEGQKVSYWDTYGNANQIDGINTNYYVSKDGGYESFAGATYVLRDGNVYVDAFLKKYTYNNGKTTNTYSLLKSVLIYSKSDFDGGITAIYPENSSIYGVKNQIPLILKTNNGYYWLVSTNKEECNKYADVSCQYGMESNEFLSVYIDKVNYVGNGYFIHKDGRLFSLPYSR